MKLIEKVMLRAKKFRWEKTACNIPAFKRYRNMENIHRENDESLKWTDNEILYGIQRENLILAVNLCFYFTPLHLS